MKFEPKNAEQELAIKNGVEFIEKGSPADWFIIGGKAGTGKTTIAQAILKKFVGKKNILVCALSHKAKLVITEKLIASFGQSKIVSKSVAGALGMKMDQETGSFVVDPYEQFMPPIKKAAIIIVDEASMINEESHQLIMKEKRSNAKVIFLGDIRQLPPIRENNSRFEDMPSPVFFGKNYVVLSERIRQGEESPILPFADFFGDNSRTKFPALNPVPNKNRKSTVTEKGALVFCNNTTDVIEKVLPLYEMAVKNGNTNIIKTVVYRNVTRKHINELVREHVFGDNAFGVEYLKDDLLMFQDNYELEGFDEPISNSYEFQVVSVAKKEERYRVWVLEMIYEQKPAFVEVLDQRDRQRHADDVSRLFAASKKLRPGSDERREALQKAWKLKMQYAPVEYAYAITSHKSQGSTYNTVVVDETDIMGVTAISNKQKSQSMYTALTRASHTCIVVDGQKDNGQLLQAVEYSLQSIK